MYLLGDNQVDIWFIDPQSINLTKQPSLPGYLNQEEQQRYQGFRFDKDKHIYLVAHVLLRGCLSLYGEVLPTDWQFDKNQYGRPEIKNIHTSLRFNLSHTQGLVCCIITNKKDCGIDVERFQRVDQPLQLAERFFSHKEVEQLQTVSRDKIDSHFIYYWTLKEAYIKAKGMGLSLPLAQFSFILKNHGKIGIRFGKELLDNPDYWQFVQYIPSDQHCIAAAVKSISACQWKVRQVIAIEENNNRLLLHEQKILSMTTPLY